MQSIIFFKDISCSICIHWGKFDVSASNMAIFASIFHQAQVNGQWKRIRRWQFVLAHLPDHESWTTVIVNPSSVKEI